MSKTGAKDTKKQDPNESQKINDVYIGVFFDGTGNNMVQLSRVAGFFKKVGKNVAQFFVPDTTLEKEDPVIDVYSVYKKDDIKGGYTAEGKGKEKFSNIAILHDNYQLNEDKVKENCKFKHFYIEGSGMTDTDNLISMNANGLGFGLGDTGVTALVSKAAKSVSIYIDSLSLDKDVNIHFYLFGFSRGATCARLLTHLITRGKTDIIWRENEFTLHEAKDMVKNGRLSFLDDYNNKFVELLGIYDTVVSIGFLMQKDGQIHPLRKLYDLGPTYKDNWHYKNVFEYGLYLSKDTTKLKNVMHICALDEFRENFALTDIGSKVSGNMTELMIPGCHSDVGGGYLPGDEEQEIVLTKYRDLNWGTESNNKQEKEKIKKSVPTKIIQDNPNQEPRSAIGMSDYALSKLGWLDLTFSDKKIRKTWETDRKKPYTISITDDEKAEYLKFKRRTTNQGLYSNIPLHMMIDYSNTKAATVSKTFPDKLFPQTEIKYYPIPSDLSDFASKLRKEAKSASGGRKWIYPGENYYCDKYKDIRLRYLHFTSTNSLYHFNNPLKKGVNTIEGSAANLGNTPNFDREGRLCRIVYHGDNIFPQSPQNDLHYMYELK